MSIKKRNIELTSLEEWARLAGPKSPDQWADDRSAKEVARAWLEGKGNLPSEVNIALIGHPAFGPVFSWHAEPETKLPFDGFAGETRNTDLEVHAQDAHGEYLIAVEAKADEPFSDTVGKTIEDALERYLQNKSSNGINRIQALAQALVGARAPGDPPVKDLRYQLFTGCAGALCEADRRGYNRTLFLVHEFVSRRTVDENHRRNAADLDLFLHRLSHGAIQSIKIGEILGPFNVPGAPLLSNPGSLFIGKVSRNLR
jgi:uncharacterized protein DUF6946